MNTGRAWRAGVLSMLSGLCLLGGAMGADALAATPENSGTLQLRTSNLGDGPTLSPRERLRRLEREVAALREQATRRNAEVQELQGLMRRSSEQRGQQDFWLVLAALAGAAAAGAVAWFMAAPRRIAPFRREPALEDALEDSDSDDGRTRLARRPAPVFHAGDGDQSAPQQPVQPAQPALAPVMPARPASLEPGLLSDWPESGPPVLPAWQPSVPVPLGAWPASIPAPLHTHQPTNGVLLKGQFRCEALLAIQQQVDFFTSLDDAQAAIGVLETYLASNDTPSPLAWLELMEMHYRRQDQEAFERVSERFQAAAGVGTPSWDAPEWNEASQAGLDAFVHARSEVVSVWQTEVALEVLENLLFQMPVNRARLLSPLAYRELLWLYEVAQDPVYRSAEPPALQRHADQEPDAVDIPLPWLQSQQPIEEVSLSPFDRVEPVPDSVLMGLDLDLSAPWNPQREDVRPGGFAPSAPARLADAGAEDPFDAATGFEFRRSKFR